MRLALIILLATLCAPVQAQQIVFSTAPVDQCLATGGEEGCIGLAAEACQAATPGGGTTIGMKDCIDAERRYWDGALNFYSQDLRKRDPSRSGALRDVQRAWIALRDQTCGYEAADFAGGSLQGVVLLDCTLRMTGRQALYLRKVHADVVQR